jgi:hypothetical protein
MSELPVLWASVRDLFQFQTPDAATRWTARTSRSTPPRSLVTSIQGWRCSVDAAFSARVGRAH